MLSGGDVAEKSSRMHVLILGLFAPEYMIAYANALVKHCAVSLLLTRQNFSELLPKTENLVDGLPGPGFLDPEIDLQLMDYPRGSFFTKIGFIRRLIQQVRALHPDVFHYHSGGDPWAPLAIIALRNYPLVVSIHDAAHHPGDKPPKIILTMKNTLLTRLADQVIVHGYQQKDILQRLYSLPLAKINVVYLGAPEIFQQLSPLRGQPHPMTILFFGRVQQYKGIDTLVRAVPLILAQAPGARIVVAGPGDSPYLREAAEKFPDTFEIHNRFIKAEEVGAFFQRAACVVLPYLDATQSGIIPTAYLFRRPVVATRVGSIPEVVEQGKTGFLIEAGDENALAEAVVRFLQDPQLCRAMGEAGAEKLKCELSWPELAEKTGGVYEKAVDWRKGFSKTQQH